MARAAPLVVLLASCLAYSSTAIVLHANVSKKAKSHNPVMMVAHGCSMTTAGISLTRDLLAAHGITTAVTGHGEMIKDLDTSPTKEELKRVMGAPLGGFGANDELIDKVWNSKHLKDKFQIVHEWATSHGTTLNWKSEIITLEANPELVSYLKSVDTKPFLLLRTNLIDVLRCRVEDFCDGSHNADLGVNVDGNGKEVSCAFRGRDAAVTGSSSGTSGSTEASVKFFPDKIIEMLQNAEGGDNQHQQFLKKNGFNSDINHAEQLFEFEYSGGKGSEGFKKSVDAWTKLLSSVGVTPQESLIEKALIDFGTFPAPKKHSEALYNFQEIKEKLSGTKYYGMLRM